MFAEEIVEFGVLLGHAADSTEKVLKARSTAQRCADRQRARERKLRALLGMRLQLRGRSPVQAQGQLYFNYYQLYILEAVAGSGLVQQLLQQKKPAAQPAGCFP
jgi:hypothetical protein